jgi:hypothetical protein
LLKLKLRLGKAVTSFAKSADAFGVDLPRIDSARIVSGDRVYTVPRRNEAIDRRDEATRFLNSFWASLFS